MAFFLYENTVGKILIGRDNSIQNFMVEGKKLFIKQLFLSEVKQICFAVMQMV